MATWNEKFLTDLRDAIKAAMEADPYYFDIPILNERIQDIEAKIDEAVTMAGGVCLILVVPKVGGAMPNILGANFSDITITARIIESLNLNTTGKAALDIAVYTASLWSQLQFDTLTGKLKPSTDDPAIALGNDPRGLTYDVNFKTEAGTALRIERLADLTIDASDLKNISLAHPQPGAVIFFTLDLSYPAPRNPNAFFYLGGFPLVAFTFDDGTRLFRFNFSESVYHVGITGAPDRWDLVVVITAGGNEQASFYEYVGGNVVGSWVFERIAGVWTITDENPSASTPPVIADNFSFYNNAAPGETGVTIRARAWLPGYLPSAELKQIL